VSGLYNTSVEYADETHLPQHMEALFSLGNHHLRGEILNDLARGTWPDSSPHDAWQMGLV
jgi:hypothetical protein